MSYSTRAYDDEHGQPVVIMVVEGHHDVSRFLHFMHRGFPTSGQMLVAAKLRRQVAAHNGGKRALLLLHAHGGPNLLAEDNEWPWHVLTRYIEAHHPFLDVPAECHRLDCPDACRTLPPWASCWAVTDPHADCWPKGLGTWRIRPAEDVVGGNEDGPNIISYLHVQVFDEDKQDWADWDWSRE